MRERETGPTVLSAMVEQLEDATSARVRRIWLPRSPKRSPSPRPPAPWRRAPTAPAHPPCGPTSRAARHLDDPARQWQGPWVHDLTVAGGTVPSSADLSPARPLSCAPSPCPHAHPHPTRRRDLRLDLVGGGLSALAGLPHVGGIAGRADRERTARTVAELQAMLARREEAFASTASTPRPTPHLARPGQADRTRLHRRRVAHRRLRRTARRVLRPRRFGRRPLSSAAAATASTSSPACSLERRPHRHPVDVRQPHRTPPQRRRRLLHRPQTLRNPHRGHPGRVLTDGKLFAQAALPRIDTITSTADLGQALDEAAKSLRARLAWRTRRSRPGIATPPARHRLPSPSAEPHRIPIGVDQDSLSPALLDLFGTDQHLLILGDNECGKTNLLKLISRSSSTATPKTNSSSPSSTPAATCGAPSRALPRRLRPQRPLSTALAGGIADVLAKRSRRSPTRTPHRRTRLHRPPDRDPRRRLRHPHHRRAAAPRPLPALQSPPPRTSAFTSSSPAAPPVPPAPCTNRS